MEILSHKIPVSGFDPLDIAAEFAGAVVAQHTRNEFTKRIQPARLETCNKKLLAAVKKFLTDHAEIAMNDTQFFQSIAQDGKPDSVHFAFSTMRALVRTLEEVMKSELADIAAEVTKNPKATDLLKRFSQSYVFTFLRVMGLQTAQEAWAPKTSRKQALTYAIRNRFRLQL